MNKIYVLVKTMLKTAGGSKAKKGKKNYDKLMFIFSLLIFAGCIGVPLVKFISYTYDLLSGVNQQGIILSLGFSLVSLVVFIFGILYVLSIFYFSKDVEFFLPLPLKPNHILIAKFITVLMYEYLTEIFILLPILSVYGVKSSSGILYWIFSIIIFIGLPIFPLVLAAVINMIIMRFTNLGKHKDALRTIGGILAMLIAIGSNIAVQKTNNSMISSGKIVDLISQGNNSLTRVFNSIFPTLKFGVLSLASAGSGKMILNMIIFIVITCAAICIFMFLAKTLYFKGVMGISDSFAKREELRSEELDKKTIQHSRLKSYTFKELKILFRTPAFLVNCVIGNFIWPVFLLFSMFMNGKSFSGLGEFTSKLGDKGISGIVIGVSFSIMLFMQSTSMIASTAISREGSNMYINKYIPISYSEQILAKLFSGFIVNMVSLIFFFLMFLVMKVPVFIAVLIFIVSCLANFLTCALGILIDLKRPKLNWDDEQKAVKQNFNSLISTLITMALAGANAFLTIKFEPSLGIAFVLISVISILLIIGFIQYIKHRAYKFYVNIE